MSKSSSPGRQRPEPWQVDLFFASLAMGARVGRDALRSQARMIRSMRRRVAELRELTAKQQDVPRWGTTEADSASAIAEFHALVEQACVAIERATAAIPSTAPPGRVPPDDLDAAPRQSRFPGVVVEILRAHGKPVTGARLRDLMRTIGFDKATDLERSKKKWAEAARRARRGSPRVRATARRRK